MASRLYHEYAVDGEVEQSEVRAALTEMAEDDVSVTSPITAGANEVSVQTDSDGDTDLVVLHVMGHGGDWTQTSEQAVRRAVEGVEGVEELVYAEDGYTPDS